MPAHASALGVGHLLHECRTECSSGKSVTSAAARGVATGLVKRMCMDFKQ